MKPFEPASVPPSELKLCVDAALKQWCDGVLEIRQAVPMARTKEEARAALAVLCGVEAEHEIFINDVYQVAVRRQQGLGVHLSIKRIDRQPCHDWRDFQEIKNQLVGPECEAVELYPAESRRVDTANQYHLWCVESTTFRFPFGFSERIVTDTPLGKSVQRKL